MVKTEKTEMSAFERKRLENIAANQAIIQDLSKDAAKIIPKPVPKLAAPRAPRKKATPIAKVTLRPVRTSSRIAGIEADSETAKRKADEEYELARVQEKAKRQRVSGDLDLSSIAVDAKGYSKGNSLLSGIVRGAQPYERTFSEDDIKETTDKNLKALREKMSGLDLYDTFEPNQIKITPERVYALGFHPIADKPLIFAGDKMGNMGIFDASQTGPGEDVDDDAAEDETPVISAFKIHSRTISSFLFPADPNYVYSASYDSSVRKLDLQSQKAVEVYSPAEANDDEPISGIDMKSTDPNLLYFTTLNGAFGIHDMRTEAETQLMQLGDKKIGGFCLHPLQPHLMATASLDRTLRIWDLRKITGKGAAKIPNLVGEHTSRLSVSHASWSAAGDIATSSYDDTVKIYSLPTAGDWKIGHEFEESEFEPSAIVKHNNQTGRWVTILKPQWQQRPSDGIQKFVIGNMNRFVDVYASNGEQLAQLGGDGISAVPAVAQFHPTKDWVAGGTASGKLCLWM